MAVEASDVKVGRTTRGRKQSSPSRCHELAALSERRPRRRIGAWVPGVSRHLGFTQLDPITL